MILTKQDFEILDFINQFDKIDKQTLLKKFSADKTTTEFRLKNLLQQEYYKDSLHAGRVPIKNTSYIIELYDQKTNEIGITYSYPTGTYTITSLGKKTLQDYNIEKKAANRKKYEEWIWRIIPIAISLAAFLNSCGYLRIYK